MKEAASLARNTTLGAISSGSANRCCGQSSTQCRWNSGRSTGAQTPDGQVLPGAPVFDKARGHLMPAGATDRPDHHAARSGQAGHQRAH